MLAHGAGGPDFHFSASSFFHHGPPPRTPKDFAPTEGYIWLNSEYSAGHALDFATVWFTTLNRATPYFWHAGLCSIRRCLRRLSIFATSSSTVIHSERRPREADISRRVLVAQCATCRCITAADSDHDAALQLSSSSRYRCQPHKRWPLTRVRPACSGTL